MKWFRFILFLLIVCAGFSVLNALQPDQASSRWENFYQLQTHSLNKEGISCFTLKPYYPDSLKDNVQRINLIMFIFQKYCAFFDPARAGDARDPLFGVTRS